MTKFTKGPWVADVDCHGTVFVGCDEHPIADVTFVGHEGSLANGQLIAASPDLFNALTVLADACESMGIPVDAARAALAKAEGGGV